MAVTLCVSTATFPGDPGTEVSVCPNHIFDALLLVLSL